MSEGIRLGKAYPKKETAKALLVKLADEDEERWIPKSCIHDDSEVYSMKSGDGELVVEEWYAEKEGIS